MQGRDVSDNLSALRQRIVGGMIAYSSVARSGCFGREVAVEEFSRGMTNISRSTVTVTLAVYDADRAPETLMQVQERGDSKW
jgi:hypothetical protein